MGVGLQITCHNRGKRDLEASLKKVNNSLCSMHSIDQKSKWSDVENDTESELHHINQKASSEPLFCADHFIKKGCVTGFTE